MAAPEDELAEGDLNLPLVLVGEWKHLGDVVQLAQWTWTARRREHS